MNDEKYVIGSGSFRLLIGGLYDLYCYHFSLTRRLAEAADEKALLKIQKSVSGYERRMKRLCRRWGLPTDGYALGLRYNGEIHPGADAP